MLYEPIQVFLCFILSLILMGLEVHCTNLGLAVQHQMVGARQKVSTGKCKSA